VNKVLVIGITGSFGGHVATVLARKGWSIRALMRDPSKLPTQFYGAEVMVGDVADLGVVKKAVEGVDLVVYAVNPPYPRWATCALPWLVNVATAVEARGLTLVFPANVYVFDPKDGPDFDERAVARPLTSKGSIRAAMEARLREATERGARVIVLRAGDFIGKGCARAWLHQLVKPSRHGFTLSSPGPKNLRHTWAYLPDLALAVGALIERRSELAAFADFHFRGYSVTMDEMACAIQVASGKTVRVKPFPWWFLRLGAAFSPMFRGLLEMRYLWDAEINLLDGKLQSTLNGKAQQTPLAEALAEAGIVRQG